LRYPFFAFLTDFWQNFSRMTALKPGQILQLNNRLWSLRRVTPLVGRHLELEAIGASEAAQGMMRQIKAVLLGPHLFIEQRRGGYWQANLDSDWQETGTGPVLICRPATALELLNDHTATPPQGELANEFSWSYSRDRKYRYCRRAYYYHYYAAWEGWRSDAPAPVQQVYLLKNLTSLPQWVGSLVHETIRLALARLKGGQPAAEEALLAFMRRRAEADFEASQSGRYRQKPNQLTGFQEHYYRSSTHQETWLQRWQDAERLLNRFMHSPLYLFLKQQPAETFVQVEMLQSFIVSGVKVWIQMDLARREGSAVTIYDWKTGELNEAEARLQLGVYALFIRHAWSEGANKTVRARVYSLSAERSLEFALDETSLSTALAYLEASSTEMQSLLLDKAANLAGIGRFPMTEDRELCRPCQFRALCGRD
jgi:hypothetical protein